MQEYQFLNTIKPDADNLVEVISRKGRQTRLHFIEIFIDSEIKQAVADRFNLFPDSADSGELYEVQQDILIYRALGYDVFRIPAVRKSTFAVKENKTEDTAGSGQSRQERSWIEEHKGPIQNWQDFETYPWPDIQSIDFSRLDWMEENCPEGMGCFDLTGHIFEIVSFLLGYETLCVQLYDDPALVTALFEKVGQFYADYTRLLADYSCIPFIWAADDLGYKSATLISPEYIKDYVFPWHKKCADIAHDKGKPYVLHSCGNVTEIIDGLIDIVGIDGKHSFEDTIQPVSEAVKKYGERISILGGIDVDFLCRSDETAIRKRVRETLETCVGSTGYCFGTGNSVANYIPLENYLVMLDEASKYSR